jgi:hypothetical protein
MAALLSSHRAKANMHCAYKIAPLLLLAFYTLCSVCPGRFLPSAVSHQTVAASESHENCNNNRDKGEPDYKCREFVSQYLPSERIKLFQDLSAQPLLLMTRDVSLAPNVLLFSRTTHLSTADPPMALLNTKLRI